MDTSLINKAARSIVGTNIAMREETLMALADVKSTYDHYMLKTANIFDRTLRAEGTTAQKRAAEEINRRTTGTEMTHLDNRLRRWEIVETKGTIGNGTGKEGNWGNPEGTKEKEKRNTETEV